MRYMHRKGRKHRQMCPPTPEDIAEHKQALTSLLYGQAGSHRATADDLMLFFDSRGIHRREYEQIDEALRGGPCSSSGHSFCLGGHHQRLAITYKSGATEIQVDGQAIAVVGQNEAENSAAIVY